jgi:uncharacterized protein with ParB-like and HNH nuclease domain
MDRVEYEKLIVQELLNFNNNKELDLNPWYQRRSVWTTPQKAYLINTIFEKKPIPSLYIRHSLDIDAEKSVREVVDGQQRIRAILEYVADSFSAKHPKYPKRVKYSQLSRKDIESFKLTSLSVGYLLGATDGDVIEIFGRLNSVAKTLNAQENRNARFSGEYKQFCLSQAAMRVAMWRDLGVFSANSIARMEEVQFLSDIVLNLINGLSDFSATRLNQIYKDFDENFHHQSDIESRLERIFSQVAGLKPESIHDTVFSRSPLFFSLCLVLDSTRKKLPASHIEAALYKIDQILNSGISDSTSKTTVEFITACQASTQRIKQRTTRDKFIRKLLGV